MRFRALSFLAVAALGASQAGCRKKASDAPPASTSWGPKVAAGETSAEEAPYEPRFYAPAGGDGKLHVYFLEVGRGEATLIVSPTGRTVLVDGGPRESGRHLVHRLPELLHESLDLVVLSTAQDDHLGGLAAVVGSLGAKRCLLPAVPGPDGAYSKLLDTLKAQKTELVGMAPDPAHPEGSVQISLGGGAQLTVYWPRAPVESLLDAPEANEKNSTVMRLTYGRTSFLFTGDARKATEDALLARPIPLHATVLKVAAHGADVATSASFLAFVKPKVAWMTESPTGTPSSSPAVVARLNDVHTEVLKAAAVGELHAVSDGHAVTLMGERSGAGEPWGPPRVYPDDDPDLNARPPLRHYVAAEGARVFHRAECPAVRRIPRPQRRVFTRRSLAAEDLKPAEDCKP